ncbi:hypothetical protein, partial [Vibrio alfacsensis]|uniref:hypothetical protein n=1 Tax=Vibrio alfacsensis TaxID=1074311 RepID=UPI004068197F
MNQANTLRLALLSDVLHLVDIVVVIAKSCVFALDRGKAAIGDNPVHCALFKPLCRRFWQPIGIGQVSNAMAIQ